MGNSPTKAPEAEKIEGDGSSSAVKTELATPVVETAEDVLKKKKDAADAGIDQAAERTQAEADADAGLQEVTPDTKPESTDAKPESKEIKDELSNEAKNEMTSTEFKKLDTKDEKEALLKKKLEAVETEGITKEEKTQLIDNVIKSLKLGDGKAPNPNESLFSKSRWSSIAAGLAKEMIREEKREKKDDSFFAGYGNKLRLIGLQIITWFGATSWYAEVCKNEDYGDILNQKFGIKDADEDGVPEFGEAAGGDTTSLDSFLKSEDIFEAHFGSKDPFANVDVLNKSDLTFLQFKTSLSGTEISDPTLKKKCEELKDAMLKESPAPDDSEKIVEFLGKHSDGVAKELKLSDTIFTNKNNESLKDKIGKTEDLTGADAKSTYEKIINTDGKLSTHTVAVTKDSITFDEVEYKITDPAGATIKSISGVVGTAPENLDSMQVVILDGTGEKIINKLFDKIPESSSVLEIDYDGGKLKLEAAKPATEEEPASDETAPAVTAAVVPNPTDTATPGPVEASETVYDKALSDAFKKSEVQGEHPLKDGGNFDFDIPYLNDAGVVNDKPCKCSLRSNQIKVDDKTYNIEIPVNFLPDKSFTSINVAGDTIELSDVDTFGQNAATHKINIKEFAEKINTLRKSSSAQKFKFGDDQDITFKLAS